MAFRKPEGGGGGGEQAPRWAIIWLDMMNSLLALFIALFAYSEPKRMKIISVVMSLRETLGVLSGEPYPEKKIESMLSTPGLGPIPGKPTGFLMSAIEEIKKEVETGAEQRGLLFRVYGTEEGPVVSLPTDFLFEPGSAEVSQKGEKIISILAKYISAVQANIVVEGHTDDIPITSPTFPSNWELSAARAAAVARLLEKYGVPHERISVVGYADTKPVVPNISPENRMRNRRVEIKLKEIPR
jgi:chemotaxis protein MotB